MSSSIAVALMVVLMGTQLQPYEVTLFPKGILLNNAGNLKHSHDKWEGEARLQRDKVYVRFLTPQAGIRAMMKTLLTYEDLYHITTIRLIIERYAPPKENNTEAYIADICSKLGVPDNMFLNITKPEILMTLAEAMVLHEQGHAPPHMPIYWYEEKIYHDAAIDALNSVEE